MNKEIRLLYDKIIADLNASPAPVEAKRLVVESIGTIITQKANEAILQEIEMEKEREKENGESLSED